MFVYSVNNEHLVILESFENSAQVQIFRIDTEAGSIANLQNIFLKQNHVEHYVIDRNLYLIACTTRTFCAIYKWKNKQFRRHRKLMSSHIFDNVKHIYSRHDLVVVEDATGILQIHGDEEDVVSFHKGMEIPNNFTKYLIYKSGMNDKLYFVDANYTGNELLINFHEILVLPIQRSDARSGVFENPTESISELKEQLKARVMDVVKSKTLVSCCKN